MTKATLHWHGQQVFDKVADRLGLALVEIDRRIEEEAKGELYPSHGYDTGTLQRSIHAAGPNYNWPSDDVPRSTSTPERGGNTFSPQRFGDTIWSAVGSGMRYAIYVHQGHTTRSGGWWEGYHYLINGMKKMLGEVPGILRQWL